MRGLHDISSRFCSMNKQDAQNGNVNAVGRVLREFEPTHSSE